MQDIKIITTRLKEDTVRMESLTGAIKEDLTFINSLIPTIEKKEEGREWIKMLEKTNENMRQIVDDLEYLVRYGKIAQKEYERCEQRILSMIADIKI